MTALEDAEDLAALVRADQETSLPIELLDQMLAGESPLRVFRRYRGLTLDALAKAVGTTKGYLSQIETGKRQATIALYKKLADALDVTVDDLI